MVVRERLCTIDIELLAVKAAIALDRIKDTLNQLELIFPDSPKFILGDFNHCAADKS